MLFNPYFLYLSIFFKRWSLQGKVHKVHLNAKLFLQRVQYCQSIYSKFL